MNHRKGVKTFRRVILVLLTLGGMMALMPAGVSAKGNPSEKTKAYLVNDDGSETLLSDAEYENLKYYGSLKAGEDAQEAYSADGSSLLLGNKKLPAATPTYNGVFEVYSTYFNYYPYNAAFENTGGMTIYGSNRKLFLEYSPDNGAHWTRTGYMSANFIKLATQQGFEISGLKPNTVYRTRIGYVGDGTYLNTTTIRTGMASAPSVKSVTAKAVNVRYRKVRHYGYYTGVYLYTEKFYTCKIKVTVKLKKKPRTAGIFLYCSNGTWSSTVWLPGNKNTYTKTFNPYPNYYARNPRRHAKVTVSVRSGQSRVWFGVSPAWSRVKRLS